MSRRWSAGQIRDLSGVRFGVFRGRKSDEDLVMCWYVDGRWRPIDMAVAFYLIDFFAENEDYLTDYRPWWKTSGHAYFQEECRAAMKQGWQVPTKRIVEQRGRKDAA